MKKKREKVFIGLSGGVDSSVSAYLLQKAGYDVIGVFIKVWQPDWLSCTSREDRMDAMRVCAKLGIPFKTLDLEKEYKKEVIDYMLRGYAEGKTPNPDVMCNKEVKFGAFASWAKKNGADFIATGHYAYIDKSKDEYYLMAGKDDNKDQSYFLWTIKKEQLSSIIFPVGKMQKTKVREIARKAGLITADKKDSQGLCFIGKIDVKEFLSHYIPKEKGNVLNSKGKIIGHHNGAKLFTIGERHGFTITEKTPQDKAYYIVQKDIENNTITVSNDQIDIKANWSTDEANLEKTNWLVDIDPYISDGSPKKTVLVRTRYREKLREARIMSIKGNNAQIKFKVPVSNLTKGQSLVIYKRGICLGGGIIA